MKLNLGSGKVLMPKEEGWVNCDKFYSEGVQKVLDLFRFPWDFPDNSCDQFMMSHIIEHIPHEPKTSIHAPKEWEYLELRDAVARWNELESFDGFFCWWAEVWRIARPGAKIRVISPYGMSFEALQDPTHTRYIVPPTLAYLTAQAQESINWDYHLPFLFTVKSCMVSLPQALSDAGLQFDNDRTNLDNLLMHQWNIGYELIADIEVIKCEKCGGKHETEKHE